MNTHLLNPQATRQLLAALLFFFITLQTTVGQNTVDAWDGQEMASEIKNKNGGDGKSKDSPILINTAAELAHLAKNMNLGGNIQYDYSNNPQSLTIDKATYFALSSDIDLQGHDWTPIGNADAPFPGNFDGAGHLIKGLTVNADGDNAYAGLFGKVDGSSIIKNLGVELHEKGIRANGTTNSYAGGIAGCMTGEATISNCFVYGTGTIEITGGTKNHAGGIVGYSEGTGGNNTVSNCYTTVNVKIAAEQNKGENNYAGGIAGDGEYTVISKTYATGAVEASGTSAYAGGIIGKGNGQISCAYNLALNKWIKGGNACRIIDNSGSNISSDNYASPEIYVNDSPRSNTNANSSDGSDDINLDNYESNLQNSSDVWEKAWTFSATNLPKLKKWKDGKNYEDWTFDNQPTLPASDYLPAGKITNTGGGNGTSWTTPILIANRAELAYLRQQVNAGEQIEYGTSSSKITIDKDAYFALSSDIDLSHYYWTPIGTVQKSNFFKGNFDGACHLINGLEVEVVDLYAGLFGYVNEGTIQNLGVILGEKGIRAKTTGTSGATYAGGIAGYTSGNIRNCYVEGPGKVEAEATNGGDTYAGGIVGMIAGATTLTHCYTTVDVKASNGKYNRAGGIVGVAAATISYTYATGTVEAIGNNSNLEVYAGGICGTTTLSLSNNLALNKIIIANGHNIYIHRLVGSWIFSSPNYATPDMHLNGKTPPPAGLSTTSPDGANTWLDTFESDLKSDPASATNGWTQAWTFPTDQLPQLKKVVATSTTSSKADATESFTYKEWQNSNQVNHQIKHLASDYLPNGKTLHIIQPAEGGTLTVSDPTGTSLPSLPNGYKVSVGTSLTLSATPESGYEFEALLSGNTGSSLADLTGNTVKMPADDDLYLSARFKKMQPTPPPYVPPVYYTVSLPQLEGATTDPAPGDYEVEAWDTFRFYLTLDTAYSDSRPLVTTSRGETLAPRTSDGAYLVKYVRTDVQISIGGLEPNNPVANETIRPTDAAAPQIWTQGTCLYIRLPQNASPAPASIHTFNGRLLYTFRSAPGLNTRQLPSGLYIVKVGNTVRKVTVAR